MFDPQHESQRQQQACLEIARKLLVDRAGVERPEELKLAVARRHRLPSIPRNSDILAVVSSDEQRVLRDRLQLKRVRSVSGVNVIGVMSAPEGCPHGRCAYCPQEADAPASYTGYEPAAMRAKQHNFDPYLQLSSRLAQLRAIGHQPSKVEIVVQGGTFLARPFSYQQQFMKRCLDALNDSESATLEEAKVKAFSSSIRNVGMTFETRPDWARAEHVDLMLSYGATRVEIGVQTLDEDVLRIVERGHAVEDVVKSFQVARDAGLKIVAHMMPGLPGSTLKNDLEGFKRLVSDSDFRPDMLKIYPCLVVRGTKVYDWWKTGAYAPLDWEKAAELIANVKEFIPPWMRIMRVQREIPARLIQAGANKGDLRERALVLLRAKGRRCRCIRCREVGHRRIKENIYPDSEDVRFIKTYYTSSRGTEIFLSREDPRTDTLIAYLRLRIPSSSAHRKEISSNRSSIVRELHVYGPAVPVGQRDAASWQHKGHGVSLLKEAERLSAEEHDVKKILVLGALGTKEYYLRAGYRHDDPYMSKDLH